MGKMFTQKEAEDRINDISDGYYEFVDSYKGSRKYYQFRHKSCKNVYTKRWANFIDAFRQGTTEHKCPYCP